MKTFRVFFEEIANVVSNVQGLDKEPVVKKKMKKALSLVRRKERTQSEFI